MTGHCGPVGFHPPITPVPSQLCACSLCRNFQHSRSSINLDGNANTLILFQRPRRNQVLASHDQTIRSLRMARVLVFDMATSAGWQARCCSLSSKHKRTKVVHIRLTNTNQEILIEQQGLRYMAVEKHTSGTSDCHISVSTLSSQKGPGDLWMANDGIMHLALYVRSGCHATHLHFLIISSQLRSA